MVERTKSHTTETIPRSFSETSRPFLDPGTVDQLADVGSAFMCEAVLRVDVVVRRASLPSIFPARASWSRAFPSPPPSRRPSRVARLVYLFLVAVCRRPRGGEGRRAGRRGGGAATTCSGGRRAPDEDERGEDGAGGRDAGQSITHECAAPSAISPD